MLYWSQVTDDTAQDGGKILRYNALNGNSTWYGNHAMALSTTGTPMVLTNGVTYKATLRIRTQGGVPENGVSPFIAYADRVGRGYASYTECYYTLYTDTVLKDTNKEWCELTFSFTTPEEYLTTSSNLLMNKCFFGFYSKNITTDFCYDIDTITLELVSNTNFYIDSNSDGEYELYSTVCGAPGSDLQLPSATETKEVYNTDGTGYVETTNFENWFADEDCTEEAILKFGNFDVNLYSKATITAGTFEGQVGYSGFDTYVEQAAGMSYDTNKSALSTEEAFTGTTSMKTELSAGESAAFELRNAYAFEAKDGKTYKITLSYKTNAEVQLGVGIGDAGAVPNSAYAINSETATADSEWNTVSFLMNADYKQQLARGYAPAVVISSETDATVYVDNVTISAVTDAAGVESVLSEDSEAVRFMMSYNCGGDNTVVIEEKEYTVTEHGVLVTGADNKTPLTLENVGNNGIFKVSQTDTSKYFNRNTATYTTVYSVLLEGLPLNDSYDMSARGYVKLSNGETYYSDVVIASAMDSNDKYTGTFKASDLIPDSYITYDDSTDTYAMFGGDSNQYENWDKSFFLCLPVGTVISSEYAFTIINHTKNMNWHSTAHTKSYTIPTTLYVKLKITGADFNAINISVPPEYRNEVYSGSRDDIYETLLKNKIEDASSKINNASEDAVNYLFITDLHTGAYISEYADSTATQKREDSLVKQMTALVKFANTNPNIDFIVIGGDIVNGYETPDSPLYQEALAAGKVSNIREFVISQMQAVLDPLKESTKPVFILRGNHDDNHMQASYYSTTDYGYSNVLSEIVSDRDWNEGIIKEYVPEDIVRSSTYLDPYTNEEISGYYYYDLEKNGKNTRIICLDVFDHRYAYNEDGEITDFTSVHGHAGKVGYNEYQLEWLVNVALKDYDGDVLVFSHTTATDSSALNGDVLRGILSAYQNKGAYSNETLNISVDYSDKEGSVLAYHCGHVHYDGATYLSDVNLWQISTNMASPTGGRGYGTEREPAFDVMSVTNKVIYKYIIGDGYDRRLIYPDLP